MHRRYMANLYRAMRYHRAYNKHPDSYWLQLIDGTRMVLSEQAPSPEAMIEKVKTAGIQIWGQHYMDYLLPQTALEKVMVDDLIKFARVIRDCVGLTELMLAGYDTQTGNALLKEVEFIAQGYEESESET